MWIGNANVHRTASFGAPLLSDEGLLQAMLTPYI